MATARALSERTSVSSAQNPLRRLLTFLYNHPNLTLALLLILPLGWLVAVYLGSISVMVAQSFFYVDEFGRVIREFTFTNYSELLEPANTDIILRTAAMAAAVTIASALIAFPLAYYMARYASNRLRGFMYLAVMIPLWSSYLVRVYAWKLILADEGIITWFFNTLGIRGVLDAILDIPVIGGRSLSFSFLGMFIVFVYIWLPYMILPINAALERVPRSLTDASSDLGAKPGYTFRHVILPLAFPGVVAGSIFTFSLTLGDYIIPQIIGNSSFFIGSAVYSNYTYFVTLSAAFTAVPIIIMAVYLIIAHRLGAFDAL